MNTKRRNLTRWQEARLRRLDCLINKGIATNRQKDRASELANAIQIAWSKGTTK